MVVFSPPTILVVRLIAGLPLHFGVRGGLLRIAPQRDIALQNRHQGHFLS